MLDAIYGVFLWLWVGCFEKKGKKYFVTNEKMYRAAVIIWGMLGFFVVTALFIAFVLSVDHLFPNLFSSVFG